MKTCLFILLTPIIVVASSLFYYIYLSCPPVPVLDNDAWWGPLQLKGKQDTSIRPFRITFGDDMVKDLKHRLRNTRTLTPPLDGVGFQYGFNTNELQKWLKYWSEGYNFTAREREMNRYPHFKTNIQGLDIHFMRIRPEVPPGVEVVPLLLLHGWPGSIREFYEAVPCLTAVSKDRNFAIEVIAPSLPGYGFSDPAVRPGLGGPEMAVVLRNFMRRLGYKKFYIQGGDWGNIICTIMVTLYPKEILGFHTNMPILISLKSPLVLFIFGFFNTLLVNEATVDRVYPLSKYLSFILEESGYFHLQATKPDTLGIAMADSPAGTLAYLLEKFSTATNPAHRALPDGGLDIFTKDQLIDNTMMYWTSNSFTTSGRLYADSVTKESLSYRLDDIPTDVPTWALQAKHEILYTPPAILKLKYRRLVGVTVLEKGGHFLALQEPEEFCKDVLNAIQEFRKIERIKTEL